MHFDVYLDESGDLGFKFDKPYRQGGSSRYLTIAYLICPTNQKQLPKRVVRDVYHKFRLDPKTEFKGSDLRPYQREYFCQEASNLISTRQGFHLGCITVKKEKVMQHIRQDPNKLYNYLIRKSILDKIHTFTTINLINDKRSIKVKSGNSCVDYLNTTLWFEYSSTATIKDFSTESHKEDGLIFIDWVCNAMWMNYEDSHSPYFNQLCNCCQPETLYFP